MTMRAGIGGRRRTVPILFWHGVIASPAAVTAITPVAAVHEHVEERAGEQQQGPRQYPESMGAMLGEEEKGRDRREGKKSERCPPTGPI